jgi:hypothetical protein
MQDSNNQENQFSPQARTALLEVLQARFVRNFSWHAGIQWANVRARLDAHPEKLWSLSGMDRTGGEPDVVGQDEMTKEIIFYDCSPESPTDRRNLCYDPAALEARKENKPGDSALGMAASLGIELLTEEQYRGLQQLGEFDTKTSSWVLTPPAIRKLGGALFADRRYNHVFIYHNGAISYYAARGFRGWLRV